MTTQTQHIIQTHDIAEKAKDLRYKMPDESILYHANDLQRIPDDELIRRFQIKQKGGKVRSVNDPVPELKSVLKAWNVAVTDIYVALLDTYDLRDIAHAYLPERSIKTNASIHRNSPIIQFDFSGFYDSCRFEYFRDTLYTLDSQLDNQNPTHNERVKRLIIDPETGGVTQGLPVSGALAGITLIPFWLRLRELLPDTIQFTQYSDDLTFSFTSFKTPDIFTIKDLTRVIKQALNDTHLAFYINTKKTHQQHSQFRKVTGIRINHLNQLTASREDYRFLRHALYILSKSDDLTRELQSWGFKSKASFVGKVSYMRSIDDTGKVNRLIYKYKDTCLRHDLFTTWLEKYQPLSPFA